MAHPAIHSAAKARMDAVWSRCPVTYPNGEGSAPDDGGPFVEVQYQAVLTSRVSVTTAHYREEGGIRLILNMLKGEGPDRPLEWAEELAAIFRDETFGGVHCGAPSSPFMDDTNDVGNYFQVAVVAPYWYQYRKV